MRIADYVLEDNFKKQTSHGLNSMWQENNKREHIRKVYEGDIKSIQSSKNFASKILGPQRQKYKEINQLID